MALLQISEPGQSTKPHEHRLAAGIDLGTTNSLIATVRSSRPVVLEDANGQDIQPSVVHYDASGKIVAGTAALAFVDPDPGNTIASAKRLIGRGSDALKSTGGHFPYQLHETGGMPLIKTAAGDKSPVQVSADILRHLKKIGEQSLGDELYGVVITVPAYFDDAQRQATRDAARLAGLDVLRLLNEPTAAAIAYGLDQDNDGIFAVYDLGGGTFDITVLHLNQGVFEVMATGGDSALGGDDFDRLVTEWLIEQAGLEDLDPGKVRYLTGLARKAKEELATADSSTIALEMNGIKQELKLDEDRLAEIVYPLVKQTLRACRKTVRDAGIKLEDISQVVMVGGSTRMRAVRREVSAFFGREVLTSIDPDRVVATGAAVQADILAGNNQDSEMLLLDVLPLSLGIETMGGLVEKIINRNTPLPVSRAQEFTTFKDGQTAMAIHVVQGERELVDDCRSLAKFVLTDIPPLTAGSARIEVSFQVDADGLLNVSARELSTGVESSIEVKPSYGLTEEQVAGMLKDSFTHAEEDAGWRSLNEARIEARRLLEALEAALQSDGDQLLSPGEKTELESGMKALREVMDGDDASAITRRTEALNEASMDYASRRMDNSIRQALSGKSVDDVEVTTIEDRDTCLK